MYRNVLRVYVNFGLFFLIALLVATLQSTIFSYSPLNFLQPDILLILVVYLGFRRDILEGGFFTILASMIMEAHSASSSQFLVATYLYVFLLAKIMSRVLVAPDFLSSIGMVTGLSLFKKIGLLVLLGMRGHAMNGLRHFFIYLIPGLIVQALLTPALFSWFMNIDLKTYKDEHSEDEYDINKGL